MEDQARPQWAMLSERVYRALLTLYPADFKRGYADLMAQAFRDVSRETFRREGGAGLALWWGAALMDMAITVIEQRLKEPFVMPKSLLPDWAGRLLMAGGAFIILSSISPLGTDQGDSFGTLLKISFYCLGPGFLLIGLGNLGLPRRYHTQTEPVTRIALYTAGVGALLAALGLPLASLINELLWAVGMMGLIIHIIAMWVFGWANVTRPILPMARWIPVLGGVFPLILLLSNQAPSSNYQWIASASLLGAGIVWVVMGIFIAREKQAEPKPAVA